MEQRVVLPNADISCAATNVETGRMNHRAIQIIAKVTGKCNRLRLKTALATILNELVSNPRDCV